MYTQFQVSHILKYENFQNYNQQEILNPSSVPKLIHVVNLILWSRTNIGAVKITSESSHKNFNVKS